MTGLTLHNVAVDALPLSATPVTLTERAGTGQVWLTAHAATPTCPTRASGFVHGDETVLGTDTLHNLANRYRLDPRSRETIVLCSACDRDPAFTAHRSEVRELVTWTGNARKLRSELLRAYLGTTEPEPTDLAAVVGALVATTADRAQAPATSVLRSHLDGRLAEAHAQARTLRDRLLVTHPARRAVTDGPWVAVGIRDLAGAWRVLQAAYHLAAAPGNVFDHPVADEHLHSNRARAVVAMPAHLAHGWRRAYPGLVEVTDVPLTRDQVPHLGLMTRFWCQDPTRALAETVELVRSITAPAATGS